MQVEGHMSATFGVHTYNVAEDCACINGVVVDMSDAIDI